MCAACSPLPPAAAREPSSSPSVEIILPDRPSPPDHTASSLPDDPWSFQRSRAPSPPPLDEEERAPQQPAVAEPLLKALPPIFKRVDAPAGPAKRDDFYPFKKVSDRA